MIRENRNLNHDDQILLYKKLFNNKTKKLVVCSLLACLSAVLQAMGGFGGPGYLFSAFSCLPIILAAILSIRDGFVTYLVTIGLLAIFQPTELIVFPFTTGILGLSIGCSFLYLKSEMAVTLIGGLFLSIGIQILMYGIGFPVLGPEVSGQINMKMCLFVIVFSIAYSWIWMKISLTSICIINKIVPMQKNS